MSSIQMKHLIMLWILTMTVVGGANIHSEIESHFDSSPMEIDVSPQCQQNALQALDHRYFGQALGERHCQLLSYTEKQILALELTKCHLDEMQQSTFETTPCTLAVQECLAHLSPLGFQSFTMFKIHIEQYCVKLNHELMILQQQKVGAQLQQTTQRASQQISELIERQGEIKDDFTQLYSSLSEKQDELYQNLLGQTIRLQQESERHLLAWTREMLESQELQMLRQREELHNLSNVVAETSFNIKNAWNMNTMLSWISGGIQAANLLAYLYVTINIQWICTLPRCLRSCRVTLWRVAFLEFLLVACRIWFNNTDDDIGMNNSNNEQFAESLRFLSHALQISILIISFLRSFGTRQHEPPIMHENENKEVMVSLERLQDSMNDIRNEWDKHEQSLGKVLQRDQYDNKIESSIIDLLRTEWNEREERLLLHLDNQPNKTRQHRTIKQLTTLSSEQNSNNESAMSVPASKEVLHSLGSHASFCHGRDDTTACSAIMIPLGYWGETGQSKLESHPLTSSVAQNMVSERPRPVAWNNTKTGSEIALTPCALQSKFKSTTGNVVQKKHTLSEDHDDVYVFEPSSKKCRGGSKSLTSNHTDFSKTV